MDGQAQREVVLQGVPGAPGRAVGPVLRYEVRPASASGERISGDQAAIAAEQARVRAALEAAQGEILALAAEVSATIGAAEAAIFEAQAEMAADPTLSDSAAELVANELMSADSAIMAVTEEQASMLAALDDPYLRERAADLRDVGARAVRLARGESTQFDLSRLAESAIILAEDITPTETARLDRQHVLGMALSQGGPTSHAAILARALGVPLVCGLGSLLDVEGVPALLDGDAGQLVLYPGAARLAEYETWKLNQQESISRQSALKDLPAVTTDGMGIRLVANAGSVADAGEAVQYGAEGIGLLRTEFLFLDHNPNENEQFDAYMQIYGAMPGREVVVRTMDLGGDKPPPYLDFGSEANPFLGWRGLRVALDRPDLLRVQLRALLRAGAGRTVHLMFPMVSTLDEFRRAREEVNTVSRELAAQGVPAATEIMLGIMVEVPSSALMADAFAKEADFFSIGTNDLTQYTMAADRGAARVAHLYSPIQPAVLRLIARTVEAGHAAGRWVGICGEAGGNPAWAPLWLGLGLDELSMAPSAIPAVKEVIRTTTFTAARELAEAALRLSTVEDIEALLAKEAAPPH
jgi:phosphoenolpyruvate-protein phosphotransferase